MIIKKITIIKKIIIKNILEMTIKNNVMIKNKTIIIIIKNIIVNDSYNKRIR